MNLDVKDITALMLLILPGVIASAIFYALTAHPRAENSDKITRAKRAVQTVIFVALVRAAVHLISLGLIALGHWRSVGRWGPDAEFDWSIGVAAVLGLGFAYGTNHDALHRLSRAVGLTTRTSYPSEWFAAFSSYPRYVLLHLRGGRRLRGWPEQWPDQHDNGHFLLARPEWVVGDEVAPLHQVERFLVPAHLVVMVEFLLPPDRVPVDDAELRRVRDLLRADPSPPPAEADDGRADSPT